MFPDTCRDPSGAGMIFAVIAFGLVSALLGDGIWDQASWLALAMPLAVIAFCIFRRSERSS